MMKIRSLNIMIMAGLLGSGLASFSSTAQEPANRQAAPIPAGVASGYPPAGGKGPGSGHSYQTGTGGPGQGSPQYQGGRAPASGPTAESAPAGRPDTAGPRPTPPEPATPYTRRYTPDSPYGWRGRPYARGQGYGYGRHGHGYGYGYPGYRGLGGTPYRHHRQFGNPPFYPAPPAATE